jgi:hypothetical protein
LVPCYGQRVELESGALGHDPEPPMTQRDRAGYEAVMRRIEREEA